MVINDIVYEDLIIGVVSRWAQDLIESARTLKYSRTNKYKNVVKIKICTACYVEHIEQIEYTVKQVCFSNLPFIAECLNAICDNPEVVLHNIWKECIKTYPYWDLYYNGFYKYLKGCLNGKH